MAKRTCDLNNWYRFGRYESYILQRIQKTIHRKLSSIEEQFIRYINMCICMNSTKLGLQHGITVDYEYTVNQVICELTILFKAIIHFTPVHIPNDILCDDIYTSWIITTYTNDIRKFIMACTLSKRLNISIDIAKKMCEDIDLLNCTYSDCKKILTKLCADNQR